MPLADSNAPFYPPSPGHCRRMHVVLWIFLVLFGLICCRLVQIQLRPARVFRMEDISHVGVTPIEVPRGKILDREDRVLARDRMVPSLWANPSAIRDPGPVAARLAEVLHLDEAEILQALTKRSASGEKMMQFVFVKRWLSDEEFLALGPLEALAPEGLAFQNEPVRVYPERELAAHVLGFVNQERNGAAGVEMLYNKYLRSIAGKRKTRVDAKRVILHSLTLEYVPPEGGDDVYLTLDKTLQRGLERELAAVKDRVQADHAMGLLMDPNTGAILALACVPTFDPNNYQNAPPDVWKNRAVTDVFEPGSSFKIVTASAALEHGLVTPDTIINCEGGRFNPYGHTIRDFHGLGIEPFSSCFAQSSNIAIIKVAAMLGPERLAAWIDRFGFGAPTSPDFPSESAGIMRPLNQWSRLSMGSLPMGQEIAVTMPQLARAFSAIANGGLLVDPYLVERAVSREGELTYQHDAGPRRRILSEATAETMRNLCHLVVVHPKGTGRYAHIAQYRVGGKTGTAQIARANGGGFEPGKFTTIFAGFAPIAGPRLCCVIAVSNPKIKLHFGGYICGPVFRNVVRDALIAMNCPKDPALVDVPEVKVDDLDLAADTMEPELGEADGELAQLDADDVLAPLDGLELVETKMDPGYVGPTLPDFRGMTKRQAMARVRELGLEWDALGGGWVLFQEPQAGTPLPEVALCRLVFSNQRVETKNDSTAVAPNPGP